MTGYKRKTRTREMYDREHLSDDEVYTGGGRPNGKSTLLGTISSASPHELEWTPVHWKLFWPRRG